MPPALSAVADGGNATSAGELGAARSAAHAWLSQESEDEGAGECGGGPLALDLLELGCSSPKRTGPSAILAVLEQWLQTPMGAASCDDATGFVAICDAVSMCADLRELTGGALAPVAEAVRSLPPNGPLALDAEGRAIRLKGLSERVRSAAELHFAGLKVESASLLDLLCAPALEALLSGMPEGPEQLQTLRDALAGSELVEVQGSRVLLREAWAPPADWWPAPEGWPAAAGGWTGPPGQALFMPWSMGGLECPPAAWDAAAAWWGHCPAGQLASGGGGRRRAYKDRREWLCASVTRILEDPSKEVVALMDADGAVPVPKLLDVVTSLAEKLYKKPSTLLRAIAASHRSRVIADMGRQTVRLKTLAEQLCDACEEHLSEKVPLEPTPLGELLLSGPVQAAFSRAPMSSTEGESTQAAVLRQSLESSELLEVAEEAPGLHMVSLQPAGRLLRRAVEDVLDHEPKARTLLAREGESPLSWIAGHPLVARCLARAGVPSGQACLDALREAVSSSERYQLDGPRMSVGPKRQEDAPAGQELPEPPNEAAAGRWGPGERLHAANVDAAGEWAAKRRWRGLPGERDVKVLRKLLGFYFDLFNLQHNQVLMSIIEAQRRQSAGAARRSGYLRSKGHRPVFRLKDLFVLPRIAKIFEQYGADFAPLLLAVAAAGVSGPLPVKVAAQREPGMPRGAWAAKEPRLELTYMPDLRFLEALRVCPEIQPLLEPAVDATDPVRVLPPHAVCVASYSVSSDLSHSQSPKAMEVNERVADGSVDPGLLTWDCRQQKIKRQLLLYDPDVICVQGVQSIGFAERCSEWEPEWFCFEDEPTSNHLVHLYRQVAKANYGVAFAPTMKLPGSAVVCFGNAIFWKRSRWQVERYCGLQNSAVCAELTSRLGGWRLAVCSSKPAAVYAKDWGDQVADEEMAKSMLGVQQGLAEEAAANGSRLLWCGDFGAEPRALLPVLKAQATGPEPPSWWNTCAEVLGEEPWTSVSKQTAHKAVDLILHDGGLRALGALGGLQNQVSLADFLKSGYPSDHLMQLAVLVDAEHADVEDVAGAAAVDEAGFPNLRKAEMSSSAGEEPPQRRRWPQKAWPARSSSPDTPLQ